MRSGTGFVFVVVMSWMLPVTAQAADQKPCQLMEVASLTMTPISENRFTVPMTVGGKNLNMLLDTADDLSMLTDQVADELGLKVEHASLSSFSRVIYTVPGGLTVTDFTHAKGIQLGNIRGDGNYVFGIRPEARTPGYDGSLGVGFLRDYDVDFDFGNGKFNLFSKDHCPGQVVYWTKGPVAVIPGQLTGNGQTVELFFSVELDGKPIDAVIDTSLPRSYIDWDRARSMFGFDEKSIGMQAIPAGGGVNRTIYKFPFKALSLGGVTVNNPDIEMQPSEVAAIINNQRYPDMISKRPLSYAA